MLPAWRSFRRVHADAFGHELPEYEGQVGYDDDDRDLRHDRGRAQGNAECGELPAEFRGQRIARVDTREDAYQRDADLDGRKEFVRVFDKLLRLPRPASPCRACISRLERRAEIMAISDMAKKPFRMINNRMMRNSIGVSGLFVCKDNAWRV